MSSGCNVNFGRLILLDCNNINDCLFAVKRLLVPLISSYLYTNLHCYLEFPMCTGTGSVHVPGGARVGEETAMNNKSILEKIKSSESKAHTYIARAASQNGFNGMRRRFISCNVFGGGLILSEICRRWIRSPGHGSESVALRDATIRRYVL